MTFSLSASGPVSDVKNALVSQAEQYAGNGAHHVTSMIQNLLNDLENTTHVLVSASGHAGTDGAQFGVTITPQPTPPAAPPTPPAADPVQ